MWISVIMRGWRFGLKAAICAVVFAGCNISTVASAQSPATRTGAVKVGVILPLSAGTDVGAAALIMRNAAEMALSEVGQSNIQLIFKDDGATAPGAQLVARQLIAEGAEIILGPLLAQPVRAVKQIAREQGIPVIAFSTDITAASPGVYLLSQLPKFDVDRVVAYAISQGKRSFVGLLPSSSYGNLVQTEFKQTVERGGGRVIGIQRYVAAAQTKDFDKIGDAVRQLAPAAARADAMFIPDSGPVVTEVVAALAAEGVKLKPLALFGTQLWDDPKIFSNALLEGGWYPGPDPAGFHAFAQRYRSRFRQDPPHFAVDAYDAVALVAALAKTGSRRITDEVLTNPSGFSGIDGKFRFLPDGTNQRELNILRVTPSGGKIIAAAPRNFPPSGR